ncbi:MAG: cytochrome c biogenesis protein CcdA [Chloroflexi bacterium]|nr:cytochrome c biogenesis protein CcdA [Chloroflexota bacterium]
MVEVQQWLTQWLGSVGALLPFGYAFAAGMVSAVNPCGFAMLPAYLGLYLGNREGNALPAGPGGRTAAAVPMQVARALLVSAAVTAGFVLVFGGAGILISAASRLVVQLVPWLAVGIGLVLIVLGAAMLGGRHLAIGLGARVASRFGNPATVSLRGFFLFGVAFAIASLSCTLPIFLVVVGGTLAVPGFLPAALQFVLYALGMGLIVLVLTLGIGVFKGALVSRFRQLAPYTERLGGLLLVFAGGYIVYYWLFKGGLIATLL